MDKIINIFNKKFPNLTVTKILDSDDYYVIEAVEDLNRRDYNDPYWAMHKKTNKIIKYNPSFDLESFFELLDKEPSYSII